MSFQIACPNCGVRPVWEFHYGGPVTARPVPSEPGAEPDEKQWGAYLFDKPNTCGEENEWWTHRSACKSWFLVRRDTRTNTVIGTREPE